MAKDYSKTAGISVRGGVKQVKGPGMNLGMKKPRHIQKPKDYGNPQKKSKRPAFTGSYLPDPLGMGGEVQAMKMARAK